MKRSIILASAIGLACAPAWADIECSGTIVDETGEPLIGVVVIPEGKSTGVETDIDGKFKIRVPDGTKALNISYIGYKPMSLKPQSALGTIALETNENILQDVVVTQSIARTRMTPVAISNVDAATIETRIGNQEFPEVLKTTPGVWVTKDGGGAGDAKVTMRGFKSPNTAYLVNGIPVNDMEWGGIYWSNWGGLSEVTSAMQTQRGLGASILSAPSVGGTVNIITRSLDAKKGGSVWYAMGNDGYNKIGATVSTGLMKNGWAMTFLGARTWSDGYVQGTGNNGYTYFLNISKRINDDHQLSFTATGAPQWHYQRSNQNGLTIEGWQQARNYMNGESPYRYNPTFGYDKYGNEINTSYNHYHKPHISLAHTWQIDYKSSLSTSIYASIATGGGYSGQGRSATWNGISVSRNSWYGASSGVLNTAFRNADGSFDYAAIQEMNEQSQTGSVLVMSDSENSHEWYGLVSNYKNAIIPGTFTFTGGIDLRYYIAHHKNRIVDLYNGEYYIDPSREVGKTMKVENNYLAADPEWVNQKLGVGDIVYRDYDGHIAQEGVYLQGEYTGLDKKLTAILTATVNNSTYWNVNRFYYDKEHEKSDSYNFIAGSVKGGANYNINRHNNVYVNLGYITRAPYYLSGVFLSAATSNAANPDPLNEKVMSFELGYGYRSPIFSVNVDAYFTKWLDKTTTRSIQRNDGGYNYFNMSGVNARHAGVEVNATFKPTNWFTLEGMASIGDWVWDSDATGYFYNDLGQPLNDKYEVASGILAPDHAYAVLKQKGKKVGGSAQWTGALIAKFRPFKGVTVGGDWVLSSHNYSDYEINSSSYLPGADIQVADPWRIPWGNQVDLNASYRFKMGGLDAILSGNVYNVFNYNYVMDAYTDVATDGTWQNAFRVLYSFGRTYSVRLKVSF